MSTSSILVSAADDGFAGAAAVALLSAARRCRDRPDCLLIDCGITPAGRAAVEMAFAHADVTLVWRTVDQSAFAELPLTAVLTRATYARLAVPELAGGLAARSLYVDADTLTVAALDELLDLDLEGNAVAAVQDAGIGFVSRFGGVTGWRRLGIPAAAAHLNGGVLLIDHAAWRAAEITERAIELLGEHPEEATFADQGAMNAVLAGRWRPLPARYNVAVPRSFAIAAAGRIISRHVIVQRRDLAILHFMGLVKPWEADYAPSPYRRMYAREVAQYAPALPAPHYGGLWQWVRTHR